MYTVKPLGNLIISTDDGGLEFQKNQQRRIDGLGNVWKLQTETILEIISYLELSDIIKLGQTSQLFHFFTTEEEIWTTLGCDMLDKINIWKNSWRETIIHNQEYLRNNGKIEQGSSSSSSSSSPKKIIYDDFLYQRMVRMQPEIGWWWGDKIDNLPRQSYTTLTREEFIKNYDELCQPIIITEHPWGIGDESLLEGTPDVICGAYTIPYEKYFAYCRSVGRHAESPLFVFDAHIDEKIPQLAEKCREMPFDVQDEFAKLPNHLRPRKRWVLYGPPRAHSRWHVDPNKTHAWNAILKGSKRWFLLPPHIIPPGVLPSECGAEVTQPIVLTEWFIGFYDNMIKRYGPKGSNVLLTGICKEGEMVFVPRGWWHCVVNLEESLAVTWNFLTSSGKESCLRFLQEKPEQIFGVARENRVAFVEAFTELVIGKKENTVTNQEEPVAKKPRLDEEETMESSEYSFWDRCRRKPLVYIRESKNQVN